jgi:3',5'-cyclic AMP phosphodiesterase CpdA
VQAPPETPVTLPTVDIWVKTLAKPISRFAAYGDTRDGHEVHRWIVAAVVASNPEFVLQTGDLVSDSSVAAQWKIFDDITGKMRASIPYYPARGNHDNQGGDIFETYLPTQGIHREGFYYSFDKGRIHFVAVDTEETLVETGPQYEWLEADMTKAREEGKLIVPFYHKATYSVGPHSTSPDVWALRPILHDLFRKHDVRLVFQGHDHIYYRTTRDGIVYVVTGGGGAPLYSSQHSELGIPGDIFERTHHFCIGDVYEDRVVVTVYRDNLSQLDTFTVAMPPK